MLFLGSCLEKFVNKESLQAKSATDHPKDEWLCFSRINCAVTVFGQQDKKRIKRLRLKFFMGLRKHIPKYKTFKEKDNHPITTLLIQELNVISTH